MIRRLLALADWFALAGMPTTARVFRWYARVVLPLAGGQRNRP